MQPDTTQVSCSAEQPVLPNASQSEPFSAHVLQNEIFIGDVGGLSGGLSSSQDCDAFSQLHTSIPYSNAYPLNPKPHHAPLSPYTHLSVLPASTNPTYSQLFQPSASSCASTMDQAAPSLYENPHAHGMSANPTYSQPFQPSAPGPASRLHPRCTKTHMRMA